jgi:opacity protein-like surface antigen
MFAAALVIFLTRSLSAQENQPYEPVSRAWAEGGVMFPQSTELHSFPGASGSSRLTLNPGFRAGLGSAYEFTPYFALDWEIAVLAATVDKASGLQQMDATITQVPFLVNGVIQYQNDSGFTPFVGVGVGVASSAISVDAARSGTARVEGSDYEFVFAWQATGGVKYALKKRWGLGVVYKYLWTANAKWELDSTVAPATTSTSQKLEVDGIRSHAVLAFVNYRF